MIQLLSTAITAALEAGRDILAIYNDPAQDFGIERKADNSPLTLADKASHQCIMQHLEPLGIPVLSEEGRLMPYEERRDWEALWIVDPLDGTKEFIKKNGEFTVNIALLREGSLRLGVIYVPVLGNLYFACEGLGARKLCVPCGKDFPEVGKILTDAQPLPLRTRDEARDGYVVVASRSHMSLETESFIEDVRRRHPNVQLVSSGSSIKMCLVAEGQADVYPRFAPTMEWDTAAGQAIVEGAGFRVLNMETGRPLEYNKENLLNPWFLVDK
ncbi:MAG: 3'(2'),5'-bisphosphate nucleotidase CysQ [Bacteroidaceae bacterium]|nr:3'(2'),5'-bisphosphate nucleotidase CysQ [Bacteroidaceae bacterium]